MPINKNDIEIHQSDRWIEDEPWTRLWVEAKNVEHAVDIKNQILDDQKLRTALEWWRRSLDVTLGDNEETDVKGDIDKLLAGIEW